jgi:hypothetical protein
MKERRMGMSTRTRTRKIIRRGRRGSPRLIRKRKINCHLQSRDVTRIGKRM